MTAKTQTPAQRVTNPVWLRQQIAKLVNDCEENILEDQTLIVKEHDDIRRARYEASVDCHRHWKRKLERVLAGKTSTEDLANLAELLGSDSTNFLGTGLTMREFMQLDLAEKLAASWTLQPRDERKRRLKAVMQLSVELARIRETTEFSSFLAESAIESVIEGDWRWIEEWADLFAFSDEGAELHQQCASVFVTFRELLLQTLRTVKRLPT